MDQSRILSRGSKWDSYCSMVHQRKPYAREGGGFGLAIEQSDWEGAWGKGSRLWWPSPRPLVSLQTRGTDLWWQATFANWPRGTKMDVPESRIADIKGSYPYLGIPQAKGKHNNIYNTYIIHVEGKNGRDTIQAINTYTGHLLPIWNNNLATGTDECHWCWDTKTNHNPWRSTPNIQHPEALWAMEIQRVRISGGRFTIQDKTQHLQIHQENGAPEISISKNASGSRRQMVTRKRNYHGHLRLCMGCTINRKRK